MRLDESILQTKTAVILIEILKEARTITKNNTNAAKAINEKIEYCVDRHTKAMNKVKERRKVNNLSEIVSDNNFLGTYKVNL